jgi:hypothetical protein
MWLFSSTPVFLIEKHKVDTAVFVPMTSDFLQVRALSRGGPRGYVHRVRR